jgi:hypothetical protein
MSDLIDEGFGGVLFSVSSVSSVVMISRGNSNFSRQENE